MHEHIRRLFRYLPWAVGIVVHCFEDLLFTMVLFHFKRFGLRARSSWRKWLYRHR